MNMAKRCGLSALNLRNARTYDIIFRRNLSQVLCATTFIIDVNIIGAIETARAI